MTIKNVGENTYIDERTNSNPIHECSAQFQTQACLEEQQRRDALSRATQRKIQFQKGMRELIEERDKILESYQYIKDNVLKKAVITGPGIRIKTIEALRDVYKDYSDIVLEYISCLQNIAAQENSAHIYQYLPNSIEMHVEVQKRCERLLYEFMNVQMVRFFNMQCEAADRIKAFAAFRAKNTNDEQMLYEENNAKQLAVDRVKSCDYILSRIKHVNYHLTFEEVIDYFVDSYNSSKIGDSNSICIKQNESNLINRFIRLFN